MTLTSYFQSLPSQGVGVPSEDDFYMYIFKVKRCTKTKSHDWTSCPFLHKGEKARRRDPQKYHYLAEMCPAHRAEGQCKRGDMCEMAHGVFEHWLHPAMFRTRLCTSGALCDRKVCFFAHSAEQLRVGSGSGAQHRCHCTCRVRRLVEGSSASGGTGDRTVWDGLGVRRSVHVVDAERDGYDDVEPPDVDWVADLVD
ncbi:hypothetical protein Syun_018560 [Stephania yunnanensis]|uniref:C3H1-type domain-containing protein n=1 Tax=Stephania yunnanensis TaxID=152371 RepID=A0AAP0ISG5_9MAGN